MESQGIELNPPEKMPLDPYTELRKEPVRKYVTPSDFDQLKQFLTFDKQVSHLSEQASSRSNVDLWLWEGCLDGLHMM